MGLPRHLGHEHRRREDEAGAVGEPDDAGIAQRLVAGDDQRSELLARPAGSLPRPSPARRHAARPRGRSACAGASRRRSPRRGRARRRARPDAGRRSGRPPTRRARLASVSRRRRRELAAAHRSRRLAGQLGAHAGGGARRHGDRAGRMDGDDLGAGAASRAEPQIDDRRPLDDGVVADDEADLGRCRSPTAGRGMRRAHGCGSSGRIAAFEPSPWRTSRAIASACSSVSPPENATATEPAAARSPGSAASTASSHDHLGEPAARQPDERRPQAIGGPQMVVGEPALVADPALVDLRMVARQHARDLALARRRPGVAPDRAEAADRGDVLDLPRPRAEAVDGRGERAHRAQLDDVAGEVGAVRLVLERGDVRVRAAVQRHELPVLGDLLGEARAAVAEDAALTVERDQRRDRDRLVERALGVGHPRRARPVAEGEVLQRALAALVAVGAVERVVQEDELEHGVLALCRQLARRGRA